MKNLLLPALAIILLSAGCSSGTEEKSETKTAQHSETESYRRISTEQISHLNARIKRDTHIHTGEEIMQTYAPRDEYAEGHYSYMISAARTDSGDEVVTLLETGLMDDSLQAREVVMQIRRSGDSITVTEIRERYQCAEGRGRTDWHAGPCN